ncbi:MAG: outer membrane beta-barrel protein [Bacteroidota bacterium]
MRKIFYKSLVLIILIFSSGIINSQIFYAGRSCIQLGYCFTNSLNDLKTISFRDGFEFSGSYEYAASDNFGIGFNSHYARYTDGNYYYFYNADRISFLLSGNFHIGDTYIIDPYAKFGIGSSMTLMDYYYYNNYGTDSNTRFGFIYEVSGGAKLMLTENIGFYAEAGLRNIPGKKFNLNLQAGLAFAF